MKKIKKPKTQEMQCPANLLININKPSISSFKNFQPQKPNFFYSILSLLLFLLGLMIIFSNLWKIKNHFYKTTCKR